jgi:hypothetical protein
MDIKVENTNEVIDTGMLVLLPTVSGSDITKEDVGNILKKDWYENEEKFLFMLYSEELDIENDPLDAGVDFNEDTKLQKVGDALKRFDGEIFYHA